MYGTFRFCFLHLQTLASLNPYSDGAQRFLRLKPLLTGVTKKERKKKLGSWRGTVPPKGCLDDVSGEGFSELDPAVLALEEAD